MLIYFVFLVFMLQPLNSDGLPYGQNKNNKVKTFHTAPGSHVNKSKWITMMALSLRNLHLAEVLLPGTHNSGSYSITRQNAQLVDRVLPSQITFALARVSLSNYNVIRQKAIRSEF